MNLFHPLPNALAEEVVDDLLTGSQFRVERIVSKGQQSPADFWYEQAEHEWVVVLKGHARLQYTHGEEVELKAGDTLNIPAYTKHRVSYTDKEVETIWLAIFYNN
ncbi:cupin domain-containing protein [Vibrio ostreicida]|uniref:Cupin domain-containing protein n=1 Tax=Vibrio ostreicida TaxID=526588 RepID=A0ABT8C082_9VIBR|nr:cupin domain-containing protein [Vibrio ostreicida]MDN3612477.1 cupin domain-containing protein [Vibrio ostreicida]NPD10184.1 cupin domain-containing protein [Vibrio ostreicida]